MHVTLIQAILIAGVVALSNLDGNFFGEMKFREPIVTGFLVGLILGDVKLGLLIGAQLQIIWMGATGIGPTAQLDIGAGGTIGTAVAILTGKGAEVAITFGLPVAVIMQFLNTFLMTSYSVLMHRVDKLIDDLKEKQMIFIHIICGMITASMYAVLTFIVIYFGNNAIESVVKGLPDWANNGLNAVAVILPALGFALLLNILMEKTLIPFFIAGFAITAFSGLNTIAVTLLGVAAALFVYLLGTNKIAGISSTHAGGEEDEEL
ncbi:PTS sugar transporter subunit IIC [Weizmannia sp. CD-2023]|uniref:PTS mannose/fructose/sorbose/N-acetylgalactosamine transporter subunit IIC n=1 Tax=Heyndrickxia TaxID=2837504 RepID=UPI001459B26E|nr:MULTISPECIES: PTS sugar transporter subunit IIC [Heyndrickxia]MED4839210.1 PTS sugar transporter subunit IIC [Weizmannia sp. CD-2023]MED4899821.1 PTS sugar transporter subunit IIC [Weizmannia sp. CD-2023]NMH83114.1 PTS sugar transporter subunit IIC [Heyndrickxia coagulans]